MAHVKLLHRLAHWLPVICDACCSAPCAPCAGVHVDLPHVTRKDEVDIATAVDLGADFLFASFVQSAEMVRQIRAVAGPGVGAWMLAARARRGSCPCQPEHAATCFASTVVVGLAAGIISKIESQTGIDRYDEILAESDGIMVAR